MAGRTITRETYEKAVEAYRRIGPNHAEVGRLVGVHRETLARWFDKGGHAAWALPIGKLIAEEADEAKRRAAAQRRADEEAVITQADAAREASIKELQQEEQARAIARSAFGELARAVIEKRGLLSTLLGRVEKEAETMKIRDVIGTIRELRQILADIPDLAKKITETGIEARSEKYGGRPGDDAILVKPADEDLSGVELIHELEATLRVIEGIFCSTATASAYGPAGWEPKSHVPSEQPPSPEPRFHLTPEMQRSIRRLAQSVGMIGPDEPEEPWTPEPPKAPTSPELAPGPGPGRIRADLFNLPAPGEEGEPIEATESGTDPVAKAPEGVSYAPDVVLETQPDGRVQMELVARSARNPEVDALDPKPRSALEATLSKPGVVRGW